VDPLSGALTRIDAGQALKTGGKVDRDGAQAPGCSQRSSAVLVRLRAWRHLPVRTLRGVAGYFLPHGYPATVSPSYLSYAGLTSLALLFSSINGVLSTQSLLYAVGLGAGSIPLAGALNWVIKDGLGQMGGVLYAALVHNRFDADPKRWRFLSAVAQDASTLLEILTPSVPALFLPLAAVANVGKNISWMSASATRAGIHQALALKGNLADVTGKAASQTMAASTAGTMLGVLLSPVVGTQPLALLAAFAALSAAHLSLMYLALRSVVLPTVNEQRLETAVGPLFDYLGVGTAVFPTLRTELPLSTSAPAAEAAMESTARTLHTAPARFTVTGGGGGSAARAEAAPVVLPASAVQLARHCILTPAQVAARESFTSRLPGAAAVSAFCVSSAGKAKRNIQRVFGASHSGSYEKLGLWETSATGAAGTDDHAMSIRIPPSAASHLGKSFSTDTSSHLKPASIVVGPSVESLSHFMDFFHASQAQSSNYIVSIQRKNNKQRHQPRDAAPGPHARQDDGGELRARQAEDAEMDFSDGNPKVCLLFLADAAWRDVISGYLHAMHTARQLSFQEDRLPSCRAPEQLAQDVAAVEAGALFVRAFGDACLQELEAAGWWVGQPLLERNASARVHVKIETLAEDTAADAGTRPLSFV
jgi:hypothetical protein